MKVVIIVGVIVAIWVGLYILCGALDSHLDDRRESKEEKKRIEKYAPIFKRVFPDTDCPEYSVIMCDKLYKFVKQERESAIKKYRSENRIKEIENSYSNLKFCGVSDTHFFYDLDDFNDTTHIEEATEIKMHGYSLRASKIALSRIKCYKIEGSLQYASNVHGGGVNLQGAAVGAIIAGDAGAVIGSHVGTEIRTTVEEKDGRKITIFHEVAGKLGTLEVFSDDFDKTIAAFRKLMPQKEEAMVMLESNIKQAEMNKSAVEELKGLKELVDSGVITQEEFDAKKKQLLGL